MLRGRDLPYRGGIVSAEGRVPQTTELVHLEFSSLPFRCSIDHFQYRFSRFCEFTLKSLSLEVDEF